MNSTTSLSRLSIASPVETFLEMSATCADQSKDSSVINPSDFVVTTL